MMGKTLQECLIIMRSGRCTATLTLVLIGTALNGCGRDEGEATRDVYRTQGDCQRDWGTDAAKCEPATSGSHAGMFYGPLLYGLASGMGRGNMMGPRQGTNAVASTTVPGRGNISRGGFGSSASAHGSGG